MRFNELMRKGDVLARSNDHDHGASVIDHPLSTEDDGRSRASVVIGSRKTDA
jgi:hypothetical protein